MKFASTAELKNQTNALLREVEGGTILVVTRHGKPVAALRPCSEEDIEDLVDAIETGRDTQGGIQLARSSQEMILGFVESHRQGGVRIPLPLENRNLYVGRKDW